MKIQQIEGKVNQLLQGKSFDDLVEIWNGLNKSIVNPEINELIMNQMEIADANKFDQWLDSEN